ncbi:zinc finger, CCHC-type containing protein [Tanacetum coccineum]
MTLGNVMAVEDELLLTTLKVVYVLTTPMPELLEDATVEAIRIRAKWENDDYICRGHILNGSWDIYTQHRLENGMNPFLVSSIIDKLSPPGKKVDAIAWWIDSGATTHEVALLRADFVLGKSIICLMCFSDDSDSVYMSSSSTVVNSSLWHARLGHVHYKRMLEMSKDELIPAIDENPDKYREVVNIMILYFFQSVGIIHETTAPYIPQQNGVVERKNRALKERSWGCRALLAYRDQKKRKTLGEKGIDCIFVGYAEHSKAYRFYVIEPNDSVSINSIIESRDAIFDENRMIILMVVPSEIHEPRKGKRYWRRILEPLMKAMQSRDSVYERKQLDDEIGYYGLIIQSVLSDLPGCKPLGCKWIFKRKMKVDGTIDKFKARLVCKDGQVIVWAFANKHLSSGIKKFYEVVLSSGFNFKQSASDVYCKFVRLGREKTVKASYRFIFYEWMGVPAWGGAISWASKKQTCITGSTMEYEFVALAAADTQFPSNTMLEAEFNMESSQLEIGTRVFIFPRFVLSTCKCWLVLPLQEAWTLLPPHVCSINGIWDTWACNCVTMAEEDALLVDNVEGGLCVDYTDAGIVGRCNSGSDKDKGKELWDSLESKYMAEDYSSRISLLVIFTIKVVVSRPVMEHYNGPPRILATILTKHGLKMDESIFVSSIIDKLPPSWKDFKHALKHGKDVW